METLDRQEEQELSVRSDFPSLRESMSGGPSAVKLILSYHGENKVTHINLIESNSLMASVLPCNFRELAEKTKGRFSALNNSDLQLRFKFVPVEKHQTQPSVAVAPIEVDDQAGLDKLSSQAQK